MSELAIYMPTGKVAKQQLEQQIKTMYLSGDFDPLQVEIGIKGIEEAVKTIRKDPEVRDAVMDALSMYNEKTIELNGAEVQKKNTAAKYDFLRCQDPVWESLNAQLNTLKDQIKARENFLKGLTQKEVIVDQQTGEAMEIYPPAKSQGETLAIKFK